jgi:hypothetical protein
LPAIVASSSDIRHKLKAAACSGSKLANMHAARARLGQAATAIPASANSPAAAVLREACGDGSGGRS